MARLIPSYCDEATSPGERLVFNFLASGPPDWVAMHSLDLAPWKHGRRTELDYIVIIPDTGILCVEVKSHDEIRFDGERWHPPSINRSPFKQALDACKEFQRRIVAIVPALNDVPVAHCCIFPNAAFPLARNLSVRSFELLDGPAFWACRDGAGLCQRLRHMLRQSIEADPHLHAVGAPLSPALIEEVSRACLPIQKQREGRREERLRRERHMEQLLRTQQRPVLQLVEDNPRVVVSGGAGTGKTFIALEVARRAADRGERVGLVCFNRLVGEWMKKIVTNGPVALPHLMVDRATRLLAQLTEVSVPANAPNDFWDGEFLDMVEERLTDPNLRQDACVDYLLVDEAQDLVARPRLWACLSQLLQGGLSAGRFVLFGDFQNQVLTGQDIALRELAAVMDESRACTWRLRENCRNIAMIGETAIVLSGADRHLYDGYMRSNGSARAYDIQFYRSAEEQAILLKSTLRDLRAQGFTASDIVVLSFCAAERSAAALLSARGEHLHPPRDNVSGTPYASVHAFKGMESRAVIMTDIDLYDTSFHRHLFYTGMTRAVDTVHILCDERSKATLRQWQLERGDQ
mgnify:CR=1 FL=1